ncbi:MAG: GreA/GreB family elongation factor [Candidatus Krumholzibacteriia bacterium]
MTETNAQGPSLIKLGKLANSKEFEKLEGLWLEALNQTGYTWRELLPIAGQVGRQGAAGRADTLLEMLIGWVEENRGPAQALEAVRKAADQLPGGRGIRGNLKRLFLLQNDNDPELADLADLLLEREQQLDTVVATLELYSKLRPGCYASAPDFLIPGIVEEFTGSAGRVRLRFGDRRAEYGALTVQRLVPRSPDHFPSLVLYDPSRLRDVARDDPCGFIKLALNSNREQRLSYRDLKQTVTDLLGEKGWRDWWKAAKPALKRDPLIGMSEGSQPVFRLMRQEERYEDKLRREFDYAKNAHERLLKVMAYLDEIGREERNGSCRGCADEELLLYLGNGAAKSAVACLQDQQPVLALAGLAIHAEVAARGVAVARPNPRAASQVLARIKDPGVLATELGEGLLNRVLAYLRDAMPEDWGKVWASVLARAGKRMCDVIAKGLLEGGQQEVLAAALQGAVERPTNSPDLLGWLWRTRFTSGPAGQFLAGIEALPAAKVADAMFALLDSIGKLYGMSLDEKHLKVLEAGRSALATQNNRPLLAVIDAADRVEALRLKGIISGNSGLNSAHRAQLLGYLRSKHADLFVEITREWEEPGTIYTTEPGLRRQQDALKFIIETEIPQVARQIGEAASFGDLSENSEYTAALEKRDQLASRATRMQAELDMAKTISHDMAASDFVNIGTRVTVRLLPDGPEEVYTFLGPWDTDVENRTLNYQAPLAQAFMGAKAGQVVGYGQGEEGRQWEIVAIEPAPGI